ncbi:hypothetical protein HMI54_009760 [Coelomomyces lativittatus]|nr:hypothetical protein HMI54_009760 [Coelomomyces lativittatus]
MEDKGENTIVQSVNPEGLIIASPVLTNSGRLAVTNYQASNAAISFSEFLPNAPNANTNSGGEDKLIIFFKVRDFVKKTEVPLPIQSLDQIKLLFLKKFDSVGRERFQKPEKLPPFYIIHPQTKVKYELENKEDLYQNCILELNLPKLSKCSISLIISIPSLIPFQFHTITFPTSGIRLIHL